MNIQQLNSNEHTQLIQSTLDTNYFTLSGEIKICKILSVYDGDTIKVSFYHNNIINKWNIRLIGINTPELRPSRNMPNRLQEINNAKASRDYLKKILNYTNNTNTLFYLKCYHFDKYGRLLGEIFKYQPEIFNNYQSFINNSIQLGGQYIEKCILHPSSINYLMIKDGYAKYYTGGK